MYVDVLNSYLASLHASTLNFVSERDPDKIVQTHMLLHFQSKPLMITSVLSTSTVFTSSYGAPRKMISCSVPSCVQEKSTRIELE